MSMIQHRVKHIPCSSKRMNLTVQCILVWYGMLTCIFIGMTELRMSKFFFRVHCQYWLGVTISLLSFFNFFFFTDEK